MQEAEPIAAVDPTVARAIERERKRQGASIQLIASENHASQAVLAAQGSCLTNKYAEGYPGRRYYSGCDEVDRVERAAIERAQELWGADHVNVQPHSGTQANQAVYFAMLEPGDTILSLALDHGGHLSHGHQANFSGQLFDVTHYYLDEAGGRLDYDAIREQAEAVDPDMIVAGFSAYPREIEWDPIRTIADTVDAYYLADIAHISGLVAADLHASPVGIADFVTSSTHKTIRAGRGGLIMCDGSYAEDIDSSVFPGNQGGPMMHNIAGKAVGFAEALTPAFATYARQVVENAQRLAETLQERGIALVTGGTDTHLVLVDLRESHPSVTGQAAEDALASVGLVVNKNTVPGDERSPFVTSGIRIGSPAATSRGMDAAAFATIGHCVADVLDNIENDSELARIEETVSALADDHPLYQ